MVGEIAQSYEPRGVPLKELNRKKNLNRKKIIFDNKLRMKYLIIGFQLMYFNIFI